MSRSLIFVLSTALSFTAFANERNIGKANADLDIGIVQLLSNPEMADGLIVRTYGVLDVMHTPGLYLDKDSYRHKIRENSVFIKASDDFIRNNKDQLSKMDGSYVLLECNYKYSLNLNGIQKDSLGNYIQSPTCKNLTRIMLMK
ncbi:hypothetical protein [Endozoicomonas sp. ALC066]|uniref:hypothetical protein n=1 Tax=Endozoicomonas sp. ALC066 TaxID=3403078 RepID=UPI003BB6013D